MHAINCFFTILKHNSLILFCFIMNFIVLLVYSLYCGYSCCKKPSLIDVFTIDKKLGGCQAQSLLVGRKPALHL